MSGKPEEMSSPERENSRVSKPLALSCTRMPSHFHSAAKACGSSAGELAVLDRVRQHQWTEHRGGAGLGARTPPLEPAEDRLIGRGGAVPDLFDLGDVDAAMGGERGLGEAGRDADPQRAGHELEKGEAALGVEAVEPAADERRRVPGGGRQQRRGDRGEPGRGQVAAGAVGPEQRHGLGAVADIVARQAVQHRIDEGRDELGEDAAVGEAQRQAVGEDGQGIAAVGIGGGAEIVGDEPQFGVARCGIDEAVDKLGEALHRFSPPRPRNR